MLYTEVLNYWFPNNEYNEFWFDKTPDAYIKEKYTDILNQLTDESSEIYQEWGKTIKGKIAIIIVLDQFTRNIYRDTERMYSNDAQVFEIAKDIIDKGEDLSVPLNYRIFILMPFRHNKTSISLDIVVKKINDYEKEFGKSKLLEKFKLATYQSYSNMTDRITLHKEEVTKLNLNYYEDVIDSVCNNYSRVINNNFNEKTVEKNLYTVLKNYFESKFKYKDNKDDINIGISLSGGVDSMVILYLMKALELNRVIKSVVALHLEYINREESKKETELIVKYCNLIKVPIYIRTIDYMSRTSVERNFYEEETRKVRFNSYKHLMKELNIKGFCLGHHYGDLGENVLMNIFNGRDVLDLFVMDNDSIIDDVRLFRPLLNNPKSDIYYIAHLFEIPYFKDSTPDWSCRGVLRRQIMPKLIDQWGSGIYSNLAEIGEKSREWNIVVQNFVLEPIYKEIEFKKNGCKLNIKPEYLTLPTVIWMRVFIKIFHSMSYHMISRKNLENFIEGIKKKSTEEYKFNFSNKCVGIISNSSLYIFKNIFTKEVEEKVINIDSENIVVNKFDIFEIKISQIINDSTNIIRNQITYDNILDGYFAYTEECIDKLYITNKFNDKDKSKKLFSKIHSLKSYIPKITSGYGFKPTNSVKIEITF